MSNFAAGQASITIAIWAKKSGTWTQTTTEIVYLYGADGNAGTTYRTFDITKTFQLGSGVTDFGISIVASENCSSPNLTDFVQVKWTAAGTPATTRNATPGNRTGKVTVRPQ